MSNAYTQYTNRSMRSMHTHNIRISQCDQCIFISMNQLRSMHIHNKRISQLHTISGNQCSARIKQLALSETYNTSPFLHFVSEIALGRTTLHKCTLSKHYPSYCAWSRSIPPFHDTVDLGNLIAWLVQNIVVSANTYPISHHGISYLYQHFALHWSNVNS